MASLRVIFALGLNRLFSSALIRPNPLKCNCAEIVGNIELSAYPCSNSFKAQLCKSSFCINHMPYILLSAAYPKQLSVGLAQISQAHLQAAHCINYGDKIYLEGSFRPSSLQFISSSRIFLYSVCQVFIIYIRLVTVYSVRLIKLFPLMVIK